MGVGVGVGVGVEAPGGNVGNCYVRQAADIYCEELLPAEGADFGSWELLIKLSKAMYPDPAFIDSFIVHLSTVPKRLLEDPLQPALPPGTGRSK